MAVENMDKRTLCVLRHIECETLGRIEDSISAAKLAFFQVQTFEGQAVPKTMDSFVGLIVMGGPMGVYEQDQYPFLTAEITLIQQAIKQNKPVLGVCLGSQLLAAALGAKVYKNRQKEIGWQTVHLNEFAVTDAIWSGVPRSFTALHWHGDFFDLPTGAVPLAASKLTPCQAFRYGRSAYGFLFHMEVTTTILQGMADAFPQELRETGLTKEQLLTDAKQHLPALHYIGSSVFQRWARLL